MTGRMTDYVRPSWERYDACPTCDVNPGEPCIWTTGSRVGGRTVKDGDRIVRPMPHNARRQMRPTRRRDHRPRLDATVCPNPVDCGRFFHPEQAGLVSSCECCGHDLSTDEPDQRVLD